MVEILEKKILWQGNYLRCVRLTYKDSAGTIRHWEACERTNCDGVVAVVPVTEKGGVIIIRQFRPAVNRYVIEFPAGLNDKGESSEDAARRELLEETGYAARELVFLAEGPVSSGASGEVLTVYLAKGLEFKGIGKRDESEDIEIFEIPMNELPERLAAFDRRKNYIDLKVFGLIELARKHL